MNKFEGMPEIEPRFTMLIEEAIETEEMPGIVVLGTVYGRIQEGDTVYLYRGERPTLKLSVLAIETGPKEMAVAAMNQKVGLCLNLEDKSEITKYAVISSTPAQEKFDINQVIENPRLLGLSMEYKRLYQNQEYYNALVSELCRANFVVSLYIDQPPLPNDDGTFSFGKGTHLGFPSLKKWDDETKRVFPVFTDWGALYQWKGAFHEGQPKQTMMIRLPVVISSVKNGHTGMVLNPFGPATVYIPLEILEQIEKSEGYRKMFRLDEETP